METTNKHSLGIDTNLSDEYMVEQIGNDSLAYSIRTLLNALNVAKEYYFNTHGFTNLVGKHYEDYHIKKVGQKFIYLDCGGSGCFLIERKTGEILNIKGYGVPDYNKKAKANLGNVSDYISPYPKLRVDWLHSKRFNYIRDWKGEGL